MQKLSISPLLKERWVKIAGAVLALLILAAVLIPFLVSADAFRPMLQDDLSTTLGRRVTLGHLGFSLFSSSLDAENVSIADDPAFSTSPFLQAASLHIGVRAGALLFSHKVSVTKLTIKSPAIQLIQTQKGVWNFSSIGGSASASGSSQPTAIPDLTVGELAITDGSVSVSTIPATAKPVVYSKVNASVHGFSLAKSFPFQLSASLPGDGTFKLSGSAGPLGRPDAADTPFNATLAIKHFDPVAAGVVDPSQGIAMVADIDAQLASDGKSMTSNGKIHAANLKLLRTGSASPQPIDIDYSASDNLDSRNGQVSDIAIHAGSVAVHVTGGFQLAGTAPALDLHMAASSLPVDQLEQLLPIVGVKLPRGSSLKGGTLTANLAISGPATAPTISGPMEIDNTQLAGFDLASKLGGLANAVGNSSSGVTAIQYVKATVTSTPQTTQFANIDSVVPSIGSASGSGTVSASGELNFNMKANIKALSGLISGVAGQATSQVQGQVQGLLGGLLGGKTGAPAKQAAPGSGGIPLTITGTTSDPQIRLNAKAMFK